MEKNRKEKKNYGEIKAFKFGENIIIFSVDRFVIFRISINTRIDNNWIVGNPEKFWPIFTFLYILIDSLTYDFLFESTFQLFVYRCNIVSDPKYG